MGIVPVISVVVAIVFKGHWVAGMLAGMTYFLYTPLMMLHGKQSDKKRKKILDKIYQNQNAGNLL